VDEGFFARRLTGQRWIAIEIVKIFGDGSALGDDCSIIKLQYGDLADGIHGQEGTMLLLRADQVDADELDLILKSLLREHDANARRMGPASRS